jgi:8-oxo-dGTP diphosphatase
VRLLTSSSWRCSPTRHGSRTIASTFLGLVPSPAIPALPPDTRWHPVAALPPMAFDHGAMVTHAQGRLIAKMSYTNIGFALAPAEFALSTLRDIYEAALGHQVDATNLQRVLVRRNVITRTGTIARSGRSGGRPAALYRFTDSHYRVTDEFAALRPPG